MSICGRAAASRERDQIKRRVDFMAEPWTIYGNRLISLIPGLSDDQLL